jgi:hypothetical protein
MQLIVKHFCDLDDVIFEQKKSDFIVITMERLVITGEPVNKSETHKEKGGKNIGCFAHSALFTLYYSFYSDLTGNIL